MTNTVNFDPEAAPDLSEEAVTAALGERPARTFIAVVSSDAEAMRWARADAPDGAVVVAQHQVGLRDRGGIPWPVDGAESLAFSLILHPKLPPIRAGRLYVAGISALLDSLPGSGMIEWPDTIRDDDRLVGGVVTRVASGVAGIDWCICTFYIVRHEGDRAEQMAKIIAGFDEHWARPDPVLVGFYKERCRTIGRRVRATFLPLGPRARQIEGEAIDVTSGGSLVVVVQDERKVGLNINDIGKLEYLNADGTVEGGDALSAPSLDFWPLAGDVTPPSGEGWTP